MGRVVIFEGVNASGKTHVISEMKRRVEDNYPSISVFTFKLPGAGLPELRDIFKNNMGNLEPTTDLFLVGADMYEFITKKLIDLYYKENTLILLDRSSYSTYVYQGYLRGANKELIDYILSPVVFMEHVVMWLDVSYDKYVYRRKLQGDMDRFESVLDSDKEKFNILRNGYNEVFSKASNKVIKIDSNQTLDVVYDECYKEIVKIL